MFGNPRKPSYYTQELRLVLPRLEAYKDDVLKYDKEIFKEHRPTVFFIGARPTGTHFVILRTERQSFQDYWEEDGRYTKFHEWVLTVIKHNNWFFIGCDGKLWEVSAKELIHFIEQKYDQYFEYGEKERALKENALRLGESARSNPKGGNSMSYGSCKVCGSTKFVGQKYRMNPGDPVKSGIKCSGCGSLYAVRRNPTKKQAKKRCAFFRKMGRRARVLPTSDGYGTYVDGFRKGWGGKAKGTVAKVVSAGKKAGRRVKHVAKKVKAKRSGKKGVSAKTLAILAKGRAKLAKMRAKGIKPKRASKKASKKAKGGSMSIASKLV